jgi:hypothetical protein
MKIFFPAVLAGFVKSLKTAVMLLKIMIPIYLAVVVLRHTVLFDFLAEKSAPAMRLFGLPGDAVVPIIAGVFSDEYAVVAAMSGFSFDKAALTTIAMIALCFHSLPVETAVTQKIGMPAWKIMAFRLGLAVLTGLFVGFLGGIFL